MKNDLISRSAYKSRLFAELESMQKVALSGRMDLVDIGYNNGLAMAYAMLMDEPSVDAVEVVRCKDCKHFCPYEGEEHKGDCAELAGLESCVYEDDFCSYGERRADDGRR